MKKLILILAALFFIDMGVYAQRSSRSSSERSSSSSRKEQPAASSSSSSSRSSAARSSSSTNRSSSVTRPSSSSSRSSAVTRPSSSSNRNSSASSSSSSRSKAVTPSSNRSSSGRTVNPSSSSGRSEYGRSSSSGSSSSYGNSGNSSGRQSNGSSYSSRGRSSESNVDRSSSNSSNTRNYQSGSRQGNGGNDYEGNNGDRRYRNNGDKFEDRGTKTRTYWDRSGNSSSNDNDRVNSRTNTTRKSTRTSVSRVQRQPETRTSVRRIERNTPNGVVIDTRGTTYRKNYHVVRETRVIHHHVVRPRPIEYRRVHYIYRAPRHWNFFWSVNIYNDFCGFYPHVTNWHYRTGARISTISAYDAMYYIGEVKRVYGEVQETFYSREDDTYYLYVGAPFPYHDFSVVIPGREYRRFDFPPIDRLNFQHIWAMGLITDYDERPEIVVKRPYQLGIY